MRIATLIFILASSLAGQARPAARQTTSHANADQLGLTCAQIVEMSSSDWVAKYTAEKGQGSAETIRAINTYAKCYDARTDQLAAKLGKSGKGPLMGARGNFQSMEQALKAFTAKALATAQPQADPVKAAYAALYEKQFRYELYQSYEPQQPSSAPSSTTPSSSQTVPPNGGDDQKPGGSSIRSTTGAATDKRDARKNDIDPLTAAKNHFGELLGDLPDEQMHDLHQSFGEILGPNSAAPRMQLFVYRYAIFLLEPPGSTPFSPPPF